MRRMCGSDCIDGWMRHTGADVKCNFHPRIGHDGSEEEYRYLNVAHRVVFYNYGISTEESGKHNSNIILTLSLLMSYIYGAPCKARNFYIVYIYLRLATLKAVSFYLLHNVSTLNQCRKFSCGTVVCKHFASYQGYANYRWDLIR
jgi:hypothetical protein